MTELIAADVSQTGYHSDYARISRSMLSVLKESPRLFWELFVARMRQPNPPTEAMIRGTRFDVFTLDPVAFSQRYAVAPLLGPNDEPWDRRFKAHKLAWAKVMQECSGLELMTVQEHNELLQMFSGAVRHGEIRKAIETEGLVQHRLDWDDPDTGTPCRCLMDKSFVADNTVYDIKTTEDPSPEAFQRAVMRWGYHRQHDWYGRGWKVKYGQQPRFLFGVVGSKPPHDAAVYELDKAAVDMGRRENDLLLAKYWAHAERNDWCADWSKGVIPLTLPRYYDPFRMEICNE